MPVSAGDWTKTRSLSRWVLWPAWVMLAACGPLRPELPQPGPEVIEAAEAAQALETHIRERGLLPASRDIASDAVLYTELMRPPGDRVMALYRDTIRGGDEVLRLLQHRQLESRGAVFELRTRSVYRCAGRVVQYGTYPTDRAESSRMAAARDPDADDEVVRVPFAALWREGDGGALEMEALWLGPLDSEVRVARLADDCRDTRSAVFDRRYAGRRVGLEASAGYAFLFPAGDHLEDALTSHGWDRNVGSSAPVTASLGAIYRLRPGWQVEALAQYQGPARVEATGTVFDATLEWWGGTVAGLLVAEVGRFRIGAGPAVRLARWSWSDQVVSNVFPSGEPTSASSVLPGGMVELGYIQTLQSRVYVHVRGRYGYFPDAETPGFRDLPPQAVPMDGAGLSVGIGFWW